MPVPTPEQAAMQEYIDSNPECKKMLDRMFENAQPIDRSIPMTFPKSDHSTRILELCDEGTEYAED